MKKIYLFTVHKSTLHHGGVTSFVRGLYENFPEIKFIEYFYKREINVDLPDEHNEMKNVEYRKFGINNIWQILYNIENSLIIFSSPIHWMTINLVPLKDFKDKGNKIMYIDHGSNIKTNIMAKNGYLKKDLGYLMHNKYQYKTSEIKTFLKDINNIVTYTKCDMELLKRYMDRNISNMLFLAFWEYKKFDEMRKCKKEIDYIFVGRISREKGYLDLIKISNKLKKKIVVIGEKRDKNKNFEKLVNSKYIEYLGPLSNDETLNMIAKSRVLLLPSTREGLGLVLIEALMLNTEIRIYKFGPAYKFYEEFSKDFIVKNWRKMSDSLKNLNTTKEQFSQIQLVIKQRILDQKEGFRKILDEEIDEVKIDENDIVHAQKNENKILVDEFIQIKNELEEKGIKLYAHSGTLLGAARDGKMIPWDNDIDVYVDYKDIKNNKQVFVKILNKYGYSFQSSYERKNRSVLMYQASKKSDNAYFIFKQRKFDYYRTIDFMILFPLQEEEKYKKNVWENRITAYWRRKSYKYNRNNQRFAFKPSFIWYMNFELSKLISKPLTNKRYLWKVNKMFEEKTDSSLRRRRDLWANRKFIYDIDNVIKIKFEDDYIWVSKNYDEELVDTYGENWKELPNEQHIKIDEPRYINSKELLHLNLKK